MAQELKNRSKVKTSSPSVQRYKSELTRHWENYGILYLVGGAFFFLFIFFLINYYSLKSDFKKVQRRLDNNSIFQLSERMGKNQNHHQDDSDDPSDSPSDKSGSPEGKFRKPRPQEKIDNWIEEIISQADVRKKFKSWINSFRYLPAYQTKKKTEISRHALLYGPTGSGKSFLAEAFAKNESCWYCYASFETQIYTGSSLEKIQGIFKEAQKKLTLEELKLGSKGKNKTKPVVIILEEIDSAGSKDPSNWDKSSNVEVNGILRMFDDIYRLDLNIIIVATTNYPDILEEALVRPGRLGNQIFVDYPGGKEITKLVNYCQKIMKDGFKFYENENENNESDWEEEKDDRQKTISWPANYWTEVEQISQEVKKKYEKDEGGFSLRDLMESVNYSLSLSASDNQEKIVPASSDVKERLEEITTERIQNRQFKQENQPRQPRPRPRTKDREREE